MKHSPEKAQLKELIVYTLRQPDTHGPDSGYAGKYQVPEMYMGFHFSKTAS